MIELKYFTPYSPCEGGFYGRMIDSVKHALIKTSGKRITEKLRTLQLGSLGNF